MNKTTKTIIWIIVIALVIWGIVAVSSNENASNEPIKIGFVAPLSGDLAFLGDGLREAVLLAQENLDNTKYQYETIFEDDQLDPTKTATAVQKLVNVDNVDVVVTFSTNTGNVAIPMTEENNVIHFGMSVDTSLAEGDYNFLHWTPASEEVSVFINELQKRDITRLSVFQLNHPGVNLIIEELRDAISDTDIEIVDSQTINSGDRDFRSAITKSQGSNPEIYMLMAFSPELEVLAKQMRELGVTEPFTSIEAFESSNQPELFEGDWYVNAAEATGDFISTYNNRTGNNPTTGAANGYDIFNLVVEASENHWGFNKPTTKDISEELTDIKNFDGALGNLNINDEGLVISNAVVRMIQDGELTTISE